MELFGSPHPMNFMQAPDREDGETGKQTAFQQFASIKTI